MKFEESVETLIKKSLGLNEGDSIRESSLEELNVDSLDLLELVMALEDSFDVSIPDSLASTWKTVSDVTEGVRKCLTK